MRYVDEGKLIPIFTASEFRRNAPRVFNLIMSNGQVIIEHRDRPNMALVSKEYLDKLEGIVKTA